MKSKYPLETLGKYVSVQGGFAFKSRDFQTYGVPVLKIKNVRLREVDTSDVVYVDKEVARSNSNYFCKHGDLLISMTGSGPQAPNSVVGRVARFTGQTNRFLLNQRVGRFVIKNNKEIDARYLFYILTQRECQWELVSIATGSANQANISVKQIESLEIPIPPLEEQKAIAHILGTLDDKIELNQQMNRTLEGIARAIFKSWFIDFDPVRAKMDGRQPAGMDAETAALFPDEFEDSPLGKIPKGWRVGTLANIANFKNGKSLSPSLYTEKGKNPVFGSNGQIAFTDKLLNTEPVIVVGRVGAYCGCIHRVDVPSWVTDNAIILKSKTDGGFEFLHYLLKTLDLRYTATGSAQPLVTQSGLKVIKTVVPSESVVNFFSSKVYLLSQQHFSNIKQSQTIAIIRDTLLPKLLSGEIRIPDAEKVLEEVA